MRSSAAAWWLTLVSGKWKGLLLRDLLDGTRRFGELKTPPAT